MNKILVEVSIGELFDKISILEIKKLKIKDPNKLTNIAKELEALNSALKQHNLNKPITNLNNLVNKLKEINLDLWDIEDKKRKCEKNKDFGDNFIKLSRDVHFKNDERARIKNEINVQTGSLIKEVKEYSNY